MVLLLALLVISPNLAASENVKLSINGEYLNYVAEVVDRVFVNGYGPTLVGQELPGAEGTLYKIHNLVMNTIDLGHSSGTLNNGSITLSLNNASASISGSYEAYTFWTTYGNLTLDIAGSLHLDVNVGANNTLNMTQCTANYTKIDLDLQKDSVNWLAPILQPMIESQVQSILCELIDTYFINVTNSLIRGMPEQVKGSGGAAKVEVVGLEITPDTMDIALQIGKDKDTNIPGFSAVQQDMCMQAREEVVGTLSRVFLPPGTLATSIDIISLLYGDNTLDHDEVTLQLQNNDTIKVGFGADNTFLGSVSIGSNIIVKSKESGEEESLGRIAMGGTAEARCDYQGKHHVVQYAINKLVPQNKYVKLNGFNLSTTKRAMVGCTNLKLRDKFVEELISKITS